MKYPVTRFKTLEIALNEIAPFVRNGEHLQTGKRFKRFGGMLSREMLANWLICVTINAIDAKKLTFCSDPVGGDGIIYDLDAHESWPSEHVLVPKLRHGQTGDAEALIIKQIKLKISKGGAAYARGKTLIVFLNAGAGLWHPNKVARQLPNPLHFAAVWVVGLSQVEEGEYVYNVCHLDISEGDAPAFQVRINKDFTAWKVTRVQ